MEARRLGLAVAAVFFVAAALVGAGQGSALAADQGKEGEAIKPQNTCPVMGGKIKKTIFADHDGKRVYFCCKGCVATFKKDPAKYIKKLEADGIATEAPPAAK